MRADSNKYVLTKTNESESVPDGQSERISTYKKMCKSLYSSNPFQENNPMVYVPSYHFSYCMTPKTGSTTLTKQLLKFLPVEKEIKSKTHNAHKHLMCKYLNYCLSPTQKH